MTEFGFTRVEASSELLLWRKLRGPPRWSSVQITSKTTVRAKATPTPELSLIRKLGRVTKFKPGRGTTVGGNPNECQGIEGNLHVEVPSDSPHARIGMSAQ